MLHEKKKVYSIRLSFIFPVVRVGSKTELKAGFYRSMHLTKRKKFNTYYNYKNMNLLKIKLILIVVLIFNCARGTAQSTQEIFVSPQGKDSWSGTLKKPFLSIERAQESVRNLRQETNDDITVYLRGGDYPLQKALVFTPEDGGKEGQTVNYQAYLREQVLVHGGQELEGWKAGENGLWVTDYDGPYFRQLYVNSKRATRARHPNKGSYFKVNGVDFKNREVLVGRKDIAPLLNEKGLEMIWQIHWAESILRVQSLSNAGGHVNSHNGNLSLHPDDAAILFVRPNPNHRTGQSYHFENALSLVDEPGEWFLDTENKKVYYFPGKGETLDNTTLFVPVLETLLKVEGTAEQRVKNLNFKKLSFRYANWTRPGKQTYLNVQAGFHNSYADSANMQKALRPKAAIHVSWAEQVAFHSNQFQNLGSTAIDFNYGTKDCEIIGNTFSDIAGGGILIGKFVKDSLTSINIPYNPSDKDIISTGDVVSNNVITRTGQDYYGTCGIATGYTDGTVISHNYLFNLPYTGISVGYGWTDELSALKNITVAHNHIEGVMNLMADGGAIYTLSKQPGSLIKGNYIHGLKKSPWASPWPMAGIYLDQMSGGTLEEPMVLERNLVELRDGIVYKATFAGIVMHRYNLFNNNGSEAAQKIIREAGLQAEYSHLLE